MAHVRCDLSNSKVSFNIATDVQKYCYIFSISGVEGGVYKGVFEIKLLDIQLRDLRDYLNASNKL